MSTGAPLGNWLARLKTIWVGTPQDGGDFSRSNAEAVRNTIRSGDPTDEKSAGGACVVLNIAAAHVPDFCRDGYKNVYQLTVGEGSPRPSKTRLFVDQALSAAFGIAPGGTWFAALELTGAGIRFYGDICLVLKRERIDPNLQLLDRNSYDLVRNPIKIDVGWNSTLCEGKARELGFYYHGELQSVAVLKVMQLTPETDRRVTAGDIAEKLRADEDYAEVLWQTEIRTGDILEARTSASDAAAEALTTAQMVSGPAPSLAQMTSRDQRRKAQEELGHADIPFRVVTSSGRIKG